MENLIGFLLPALIDLINRHIESRDLRFWISVLVCSLVGLGLVALDTNLFLGMTVQAGFEAVAIRAMAMFGIAQIVYKNGWENSDTRDSLGLNAKTN